MAEVAWKLAAPTKYSTVQRQDWTRTVQTTVQTQLINMNETRTTKTD